MRSMLWCTLLQKVMSIDRSIQNAIPFLDTNVKGTCVLLDALRKFPHVHFHHVSTDEVYGSLGNEGAFTEESSYRPNSPYAASKAAADHFVRAFSHTYHVSTTISHCCNNFGPNQFPEKFIPLMIVNALQKRSLPVYGKGLQRRQWLYVDDHTDAVWKILQFGKSQEVYDIGGVAECSNLELLQRLLEILSFETQVPYFEYERLIRFVEDRPGHDFRYCIDSTKIERELDWTPKIRFEEGLRQTVGWYRQAISNCSDGFFSCVR